MLNNPTQKQERKTKRICESPWHEQVVLKVFERCPICYSESCHRVIIDEEAK